MDLTTKVNLVRSLKECSPSGGTLPTVKDAAKLLDINRTSVYYKGRMMSDTELEIMNHIDRLHTDHPTWGKRQLASQLQELGYKSANTKSDDLWTKWASKSSIPNRISRNL